MSLEVVSLGCRLNLSESETLRAMLGSADDLVVINSCAVTGEAVRQTRWCEERAPNLPVLIVGSDCVYWEELHEPLERTIFALLSRCAPGSLCVLAGMRRWKRDNTFYQTLGKRTRTATRQLRCTCVHESVSRSDNGQREVMRVFVVEIIDRN